MKYGVETAAIAANTIAGSRYTSGNLFRQGYWRGANGKFYSAVLSQKGVKGWVFYKGSANIAMSRVRGIGIFGKGLGYLGLGYTGYTFAQNPTLGTGFNLGVNLASLAFWELGAIYGAGAFMSWASSYERSRIQENIFNNRDPLNNIYNPGLGY